MSTSPIRHHLPALLIIIVVIIAGVLVLPSLPEEVPIHYDAAGNPDAYGPPTTVVILFSIFLPGMFVFILLSDILMVYRILPGRLMAAANTICAATMSVVYGTALAVNLVRIESIAAGLTIGFAAVFGACFVLYFREARRLDESTAALGSPAYFEKTRPSWFFYLFFFTIPLVPRYLLLNETGIGILGVLYRVTIPWYDVESVTAMGLTQGGKKTGLPVKIYHKLTDLVLIRITGKKSSLIISPEKREEYLRTASSFMGEKPTA